VDSFARHLRDAGLADWMKHNAAAPRVREQMPDAERSAQRSGRRRLPPWVVDWIVAGQAKRQKHRELVGLIVVAIGVSFGANAGYAINPAYRHTRERQADAPVAAHRLFLGNYTWATVPA
jgi:hypothetical protein